MPDIALLGSNGPGGYPLLDIQLTPVPAGAGTVAREVSLDDGLDTAVYISLFTDARADPDSAVDKTDLRGWWGDEFGPIGSLLWQLTRGKATDEVVAQAKVWAEDSLAWLVTSGVAASATAQAVRIGLHAISIVVTITKPDSTSSTFRYALNWAATG